MVVATTEQPLWQTPVVVAMAQVVHQCSEVLVLLEWLRFGMKFLLLRQSQRNRHRRLSFRPQLKR